MGDTLSKEFAKSFYKSKAWQATRQSYITSVFGLCETCKKTGYIVHHKKYVTPDNIDDPYITLAHDNLLYLCLECHNAIHGNAKPTREDVMFTPDGQLVKKHTAPGVF